MKARAPWASWHPVSGKSGLSMTGSSARKLTIHTTEGSGWVPWDQDPYRNGVPHLQLNPATGEARQMIDLDRGAYSLRSQGAPNSPNMNAGSPHVQIEVTGWANKMPNYSDSWYAQLGEWVGWLCDNGDIPTAFPFPFTGSDGYGQNGAVRQSWETYRHASGIVGHSHAPGNTHWDPGNLDTERLGLMALSQDDVDRIAKAVWKYRVSEDHDAGWHLRVAYKTVRQHLGTGGGPEPWTPVPAAQTLLARVWDAVKPADAASAAELNTEDD